MYLLLPSFNILSFYKLIVKKNTLQETKKRPHICGAGWWGTLFLNQFLKNCNPLSVVQLKFHTYTIDSALVISVYLNVDILKYFSKFRSNEFTSYFIISSVFNNVACLKCHALYYS